MATRHRSDIQGLRAIAVGAVILYHVRPNWFPGGFVGVDVFFVISGFLITSSLVAETVATGSVSLARFWGRRIRRLLPAATVVLVAIVAFTAAVLSMTQWTDVVNQTVASALSVQNWVLAANSVSYLDATSLPSPLQHFWTLSVEEQFYVAWPLLIVAMAAIARGVHAHRDAALRYGVIVLAVASFGYSLYATWATPDLAYFSTFTRAWELLSGAALALWMPRVSVSPRVSSIAFVGGLAAIVASVWLLTPQTAFPGVAALLPTLGAVGVIGGGIGAGVPLVRRLLEALPMTWLGGISYSLYLWHWPFIVFLGAYLGAGRLPVWAVAVAIVGSVVLAALSKRFVEDVFLARRGITPEPRSRRARFVRSPFVLAFALLSITAIATGTLRAELVRVIEEQRAMASPENSPGGRLLDPAFDFGSYPDLPIRPGPDVLALSNVERQLNRECMTSGSDRLVTSCEAGDPDGGRTVLLAGDSHTAEWLPAVDEIAQAEHWRVVLAAKQSCPLATVVPGESIGGAIYPECVDWNDNLRPFIADLMPDLVITSAAFYGYNDDVVAGDPAFDDSVAAAYARQQGYVLGLGIPVVAISETPVFTGFSAADCLSKPKLDVDACTREMTAAMVTQPSRIDRAAALNPGVVLLNFNDLLCPDGVCNAAIGNIVTFRDDNHFTDPFARSLSWAVRDRLLAAAPQFFEPTAR